jgi:myosin I
MRIQRFWKNNKGAIVYAQVRVRDYGHQILAIRMEQRRFSLLSYRRFAGDYLDVSGNNKEAFGESLETTFGIGCDWLRVGQVFHALRLNEMCIRGVRSYVPEAMH